MMQLCSLLSQVIASSQQVAAHWRPDSDTAAGQQGTSSRLGKLSVSASRPGALVTVVTQIMIIGHKTCQQLVVI